MFRANKTTAFIRKPKQPVEGLFCMYSHRVCMQNRLDGYEYCLRHILEDKNAPFKQCCYSSGKSGKRCNNASPKSDRKDGYCLEHSRRAILMRQRAARKKKPKETPETLLEGLDHYSRYGRQRHADDRKQSVASKALEYASSSDSDAEMPVVDQAWKGDNDSDAESVDSEQEDPLKHAGVYTAEEVALIMRDKLIRLQSLYIDQFKRLQHVMREKRRKYLHTRKYERNAYGGLSHYYKDPDQQDNINRMTAMNRYHSRFGTEALHHRQSKQRRIEASEGSNYKAPPYPTCVFIDSDDKCPNRTLPLSKYCNQHILSDAHQVLFGQCQFGDGICRTPVSAFEDLPYCPLHVPLCKDFESRITQVEKAADENMEVKAEVSSAQPPSACIITTTAQSSSAGNQPRTSQDLNQDTEEALMKKGRLLLQHLQSLDAKLNSNSSGSGHPTFTTISFPRNLLPTPRLTANFTPPQVQGPTVPQTVSTSNLLPVNLSRGASNPSRQERPVNQTGPS